MSPRCRVIARLNSSMPGGVDHFLNCFCGGKITISAIHPLPATYGCLCGREYDMHGNLVHDLGNGGVDEPTKDEVAFEFRSEWQKPDCLFCGEAATLEAVYGTFKAGLRVTSRIRCCGKAECKELAVKRALDE